MHPLITLETTLEDYEEAFTRLASGRACKIILRPQREPLELPKPTAEEIALNNSLEKLNIHGTVHHR